MTENPEPQPWKLTLGRQNLAFDSNSRILRAKASFWPIEKLRLLALYHHTELISGPSGALSDEWTLIADWYPTERVGVSFLVGYSKPGKALRASGLNNFFTSLNSDAVSALHEKPALQWADTSLHANESSLRSSRSLR